MAVNGMDGRRRGTREEREKPVSKHKIRSGYGEWAEWHGTGRPNLSRGIKRTGANEYRGKNMLFPDQLTTSRIDNHTRLIPNLLKCYDHTNIYMPIPTTI